MDSAAIEYASRLFHDPDLDVVQTALDHYEAAAPEDRKWMVASLSNWADTEACAWDALTRIAERTLDRCETAPPILADFAMLALTGRRVPPGKRPGRPSVDFNDTMRVYAAVLALTNRGYTKIAAYEQMAAWRHHDPDTIRKTCQGFIKKRPFPA